VGKASAAKPAVPFTSSTGPSEAVASAMNEASSSVSVDPLLPSTTPAKDHWKVVQRKAKKLDKAQPASAATLSSSEAVVPKKKENKRGKKNSGPSSSPPVTQTPATKRKLVSPKSSAVVVTLTPEAIEKGETYESVLRRARETMGDSATLGITPARCRQTQTGARLFEFPGALSGTQADTFAAKLREAVAGVAKVARPVKNTTLLVADLDDSVTKADVVAKVAAIGACEIGAIKAGEIRIGRAGVGALHIQCPTTVAKLVLSTGRLLVGWSSASVRALEDEPLRCYKCLGTGHTRIRCPSSTDRSELCFRCGTEGHKAESCKAKPHCAVCAESGLPAGHIMRGRKCKPPSKKGKQPALTRATVIAVESTPAMRDGAMSE
jgi:hypothetical protein